MRGKVYLIGAGPGSPGLITVRGLEVLKQADVIFYDRLVHPYLLNFAPQARKIYCGKNPGRHVWEQERINAELVKEVKKGKIVVRLKGGDPFIFGRGGEEALALAKAQIPFEVIPGVSSAIGVPSSLGIPLTHRGKSSTLAIVTGRQDPTSPSLPIDWESVSSFETIVILMGVKSLPEIVKKILNKKSPKTPVSVISWGTFSKQRIIKGTLIDIVEKCFREKVKPPSVVVIGEVVNFSQKLFSLRSFPFLGYKSLILGSRGKVMDFGRKLCDLGFEVEVFFYERKISNSLWDTLNILDSFKWLIFKDAEAVEGFFYALKEKGYDLRKLSCFKLGGLNSKAVEELKKRGLFVDGTFSKEDKFPEEALIINSYKVKNGKLGAKEVCAFQINFAQRIAVPKRVDFTFILSPSAISLLSKIPMDRLGLVFLSSDCAQTLEGENYSFIQFDTFSQVEEFLYNSQAEVLKEAKL